MLFAVGLFAWLQFAVVRVFVCLFAACRVDVCCVWLVVCLMVDVVRLCVCVCAVDLSWLMLCVCLCVCGVLVDVV